MIDSYVKTLNSKVIERNRVKKDLKELERKLDRALSNLNTLESARVIFQKATQVTQRQLSFQISKIVTSALAAVFDDPYEFKANFVQRRNVTECDLVFVKNGKEKKPLDSCGYGAADIASLALRVAYWKLDDDSRNTLILDEPTRNLDAKKQPLASLMIKKLSQMNLQFIIVTHRTELAEAADRRFEVTKTKDISSLKRVA